MKSRFIAVVHKWFVTSKGAEVVKLEAATKADADREAAVLLQAATGQFCHAEVTVIELETGERLPESRAAVRPMWSVDILDIETF